MADKNLFVTGASGLIGGAVLYDGLRQNPDCHWRALVRGADQNAARAKLVARLARFCGPDEAARLLAPVEVIAGCLDDLPVMADRLNDVTHILHLAADTSFSSGTSNWAVNFEGTLALAEAAGKMPRLQRFLHVSTATICGSDPHHLVHEEDFPCAGVEHLVEYTRAKAAVEFVLRERYRNLPVVIARPSIVAGHTKLGVRPSSSIFWFVRFAERIGLVPGSPDCHVDIVPSDWTARCLIGLLLKPELAYQTYHVSAGLSSRSVWKELAEVMAALRGETPQKLDAFSPEHLHLVRDRVTSRLGYSGRAGKLIVRAAQRYYRFCNLDVTFDNSRLLAEGFEAPPKLKDYIDVCLNNPPNLSILEGFMDDAEMFQGLVDAD